MTALLFFFCASEFWMIALQVIEALEFPALRSELNTIFAALSHF